MKDNFFIDTNICVYSIGNDTAKKEIAKQLIKANPVISTQVFNELINVMRRKLKFDYPIIESVVQHLNSCCKVQTVSYGVVIKAIKIAETYQYSYYDSLIIAAALEKNCNILYSEDMQHGHLIENSLKIINPFI